MRYDVPIHPIYLHPRSSVSLSLWRGKVGTPGRWLMPEIIELVAEAYDLKVDDLLGHCRERRLAWPRQHAMWLMSQQAHLSLPMIGRFLGGRDHTTVLHGIKRHQDRLAAELLGREAA